MVGQYANDVYIAGTNGGCERTSSRVSVCPRTLPQYLCDDDCRNIAMCDYTTKDHVHGWIGGQITWVHNQTCPKGWGGSLAAHPDDTYSVSCAQGYAKNGVPIYNTVTKYRDTVYNYTAGRIAKA